MGDEQPTGPLTKIRFGFSGRTSEGRRYFHREVEWPTVPRVGEWLDFGLLESEECRVVRVSWTIDGAASVSMEDVYEPSEAHDWTGTLRKRGWQVGPISLQR
jgi:hypothetical protein